MTFLLQKFNAINRTRTEVRARNGLRPTASGIAFTGRLAACLLLAGFLGVGSAMAQPTVLRMGGGPVSIGTGNEQVHHYLIDTDADGDFDDETLTAAGTNPTGQGGTVTNTFIVGGLALVTRRNDGVLMVSPISPGAFKIAAARSATEDLGDSNPGTPYEYVVLSGHAPMLTGIPGDADVYNRGVYTDAEPLSLTPRDETSKDYDLLKWFTDPNEIFLTYTAEADKVERCDGDPDDNPNTTGCAGADDKKKMVDVVTATVSDNKLTIKLTDAAKNDSSDTDVWVLAHDANGEYARKQIQVTVGSATNPYVDTPLADVVLREDAADNTTIDLAAGFKDPDVAATDNGRNAGVMDAVALSYEVDIDDNSAAKVGPDDAFTWVTTYMTAKVATGDDAASVEIRPRAPGSATFTVTATDKGVRCRESFFPARLVDMIHDGDTVMRYSSLIDENIPAERATKCLNSATGPNTPDPDDGAKLIAQVITDLYPDAKSVKDAITVTIVSKTSPMADEAIGDREVVADKDAIMVDLEDMNGDKDDEPAAFADPTKEGLTYTVEAKDAIATLSVEGSVVTIAPKWRAGDKSTTVTVKATNNLDEESLPVTFKLTVKTATTPVVNMNPAVQAVLAKGFSLKTGDAPMVVNLMNLTGAKEEKDRIALFIDPNAAEKDALPGGLLYKMQVKDVVADHVYENQSKENDVSTSAMRLVLDPAAATLTVTPTAASFATVTVWGIDRERNMISATTTITVVSCDGVDMSDPCDGVTVGAEDEELPTEVSLAQNYPNPFNPQTTIDYALPQAGDVSLIVYDMLGREVDVLLDGPQAAGRHTVRFGANHLPNGAYVYRLVAADKTITRTMVLLK